MKALIMRRILGSVLCIFVWQTWTIAQNPTQNANPEIKLQTNEELNLLHFGDLLDVDVVGSFEYDWRGTLTPEGFINGLDALENRIYGLCRSEEDVAKDIAAGFSKID